MMLSVSDNALGKINRDKTPDESEEAEIGNFDFIYGTQDDLNEAFEKTEMLMSEAFSHMGARYRSGGKGPSAFDCSGFTSYVYRPICSSVLHQEISMHAISPSLVMSCRVATWYSSPVHVLVEV